MPKKVLQEIQLPINKIYKTIQDNQNASYAAHQLGLRLEIFNMYLACGRYKGDDGLEHPLTFDVMKKMDEKKALQIWGDDYYKPLKVVIIPIEERTKAAILEAILNNPSQTAAANSLGIKLEKFKSYLETVFYIDKNGLKQRLTYDVIKNMSGKEAIEIWGDDYYKPFQVEVRIEKKTIKEIHKTILGSLSLEGAASKLKVKPETLSFHLAKIPYGDEGVESILTYEILKNMTEKEASELWGEEYDRKPKKSLSFFGGKYGAPLDKSNFSKVNSQFETFYEKSFITGKSNPNFFNYAHTSTMQNEPPARAISYPFREIDKIISGSASLEQASILLGTSQEVLIKELSKLGLTYADIKQNTERYKSLKDLYIKENVSINIELSSVKKVYFG